MKANKQRENKPGSSIHKVRCDTDDIICLIYCQGMNTALASTFPYTKKIGTPYAQMKQRIHTNLPIPKGYCVVIKLKVCSTFELKQM